MIKNVSLFLFILLLIMGMMCCKQKSTADNNDAAMESAADDENNSKDLLPFEVESKIASDTVTNKILSQINGDILNWINKDVIINAVEKANQENANRTQEEINKLDNKWKNTSGTDDFIETYLNNDAAKFLKDVQKQSNGLYSEIFVMDFQGCNVAMSNKTSDFLQGDEDKFKISYNDAKGKIFLDNIEFDESTKENLVQVSLPITDSSKNVIGAITIGISIDKM